MNLRAVLDKLIYYLGEFLALGPRLAYKNRSRQAFCDGLLIGSAPWACYCCQTVQAKIKGQTIWDKNPTDYRHVTTTVIVDQFGRKWQWPAVKWVYLPSQMFRR